MKLEHLLFIARIIELTAILLIATSCTAKAINTDKSCNVLAQSENVLTKALGDSISHIIMKAKNVEISTDSSQSKRMNSYERSVVQYLIADSCNFSTDTKVFGQFVPYLCIKFCHYRKSVKILFDFRLHKWMIKGANEKLLCMYDLKSEDILRFAALALPEDKYIYEFVKKQEK